MRRFAFSYDKLEHYLERCPFTEDEKEVVKLRRRGKSVTEMAFALRVSERTVCRRLESASKKIQTEDDSVCV